MMHAKVLGNRDFTMLDLLGIVFSTAMMLLVIVRAVQLDAMLPWFAPRKEDDARPEPPPKQGGATKGRWPGRGVAARRQ